MALQNDQELGSSDNRGSSVFRGGQVKTEFVIGFQLKSGYIDASLIYDRNCISESKNKGSIFTATFDPRI